MSIINGGIVGPTYGLRGGGGGLHFRSPADIFTGTNLAACFVARDTYFNNAANAGALANFQGDPSLAIILNPDNSTDNTFQTYLPGQAGNPYASNQWVERTDAIQGNRGLPGSTAVMVTDTDLDVDDPSNEPTNVAPSRQEVAKELKALKATIPTNRGNGGDGTTPTTEPTEHTVKYGLLNAALTERNSEATVTLYTPPNTVDIDLPAPTPAYPNWYVEIPEGKTFSRMISTVLRDVDVSDQWTADISAMPQVRVYDDTVTGVVGRVRLEVTG